jgi:type IV secretory pathway TrbF-like protein
MFTAPRPPGRAIETPALDGKKNHETLYGSMARSAYHWRFFALALLGLVLWDRIQFMFLLSEKQYTPVVIAEHDDGSMRFVGEPDPTWRPSDRNILDELKWTVQTIRGRTADAWFDKRLWQRVYDRSTEKGRNQLPQAYADLTKGEEKGRIAIDVLSINKLSEHVFDVRWQERRHDVNNTQRSQSHWRGVFTVAIEVPRTLAGFAQNEKGVWIDGWSIAKEEL